MLKKPINFDKLTKEDGVYILQQIDNSFEATYLKVREKENRIYSDNEVEALPFTTKNIPHKDEWKIREKSFLRFNEYLSSKRKNLSILDLGCGNGWFCGQLSKSFNNNFYCVDVNLTELKQGRRVYDSERLKLFYADIFTVEIPESFFELITINAAVQYFPNIKILLDKLLHLLKEKGEIHIIDSPFYSGSELANAKKRSMDYYSSLGFPEMAAKYFHHTYKNLSYFNYHILYNPQSLNTKLKKIFFNDFSPFPWIVVTK